MTKFSQFLYIFSISFKAYLGMLKTPLGFLTMIPTYILIFDFITLLQFNGSLTQFLSDHTLILFNLNFFLLLPIIHIILFIMWIFKTYSLSNTRQEIIDLLINLTNDEKGILKKKIDPEKLILNSEEVNTLRLSNLLNLNLDYAKKLYENGLVEKPLKLLLLQGKFPHYSFDKLTFMVLLHELTGLHINRLITIHDGQKAEDLLLQSIKILGNHPDLILLKSEVEFLNNEHQKAEKTKLNALKMLKIQEKTYEKINYIHKKKFS